MPESRFAVYASIAANVIIAATKLTAGAVTGSSAMLAEGFHSLADSGDGTLLLLGHALSARPPDPRHPFGHGKELYFWSLMVAVVFFALGGGLSIYEGVHRLLHPEPLHSPLVNYVVLGIAALVDGSSFVIGVRQFRRRKGTRGYVAAIVVSKDPTVFTVVLEDSGDLVGIALAFLGVFLSHTLGMHFFDGAASIAVGIVLAAIAMFLGNESRSLLVGESAAPAVVTAIRQVGAKDAAVASVEGVRTLQMGAGRVLAEMRVSLRPGLTTEGVAAAICRLEDAARAARPEVYDVAVVPVAGAASGNRTS